MHNKSDAKKLRNCVEKHTKWCVLFAHVMKSFFPQNHYDYYLTFHSHVVSQFRTSASVDSGLWLWIQCHLLIIPNANLCELCLFKNCIAKSWYNQISLHNIACSCHGNFLFFLLSNFEFFFCFLSHFTTFLMRFPTSKNDLQNFYFHPFTNFFPSRVACNLNFMMNLCSSSNTIFGAACLKLHVKRVTRTCFIG